jgi:hypothetical protein
MKTKTKQQEQVKTDQSRPVHQIRLGSIKAAIWRNEIESGGTRFNVQFSRRYKDGETWRTVSGFGRDDLLVMGKVADLTHSWIHQQEQEAAGSKQPPAETAETSAAQS